MHLVRNPDQDCLGDRWRSITRSFTRLEDDVMDVADRTVHELRFDPGVVDEHDRCSFGQDKAGLQALGGFQRMGAKG